MFAQLVRQTGLDLHSLCRDLVIDSDTLDCWLSGSTSPPDHVIRAIQTIADLSPVGASNLSHDGTRLTASAEDDSPTLVSLFAGAGGLDIGLERAGFRTILANEIEPHACETLRANKLIASFNTTEFSQWFEASVATQRCYKSASQADLGLLKARLSSALTLNDQPLFHAQIVECDVRRLGAEFVRDATSKTVGEIDLIAGGAPCQPFSRAGKQETVDCDDGRLFLEFVRLVDELRPRWFLFENVKGLTQHRTDALYSTCRDCGATRPVSFALRASAASLGGAIDTCASCRKTAAITPQWKKQRGGSLDMIEAEFSRLGYTCNSAVLNARDFGVPQDRERLFIIGSRDNESFAWPEPTHGAGNGTISLFGDGLPKAPRVSLREALYRRGHWRYGDLDERAVLWVKNVVRPHDEPVTWSLDRVSPTIGAHQAAKLAIAPHGVPAAQLARQQWHTLGHRQGDTPPVFVEHEYLTDHELLVLQTFPEHWYLHGTRMERAFQIGNAVPPALGAVVGGAIMQAMAGRAVSNPSRAIPL